MKVAVLALVGLGVLAAGCAAVLIAALAARSDARQAPKQDAQVEILVATRDLPEMSLIDTPALKTKKVLKSQVPPDALLDPVQVVGKVTTKAMLDGQPFTVGCFAREGRGVSLAAAVPVGKRAMSVQLTDWSGMAGLLYPGSVVDVLVSFRPMGAGGQGEMLSTTLLQGMQVLAIGSQSIADDQYKDRKTGALATRGEINTRMVTLLVDPKQAEILQLAMQNGSISLVMRNPRDNDHNAPRLTRAREIIPGRGELAMTSDPSPNASASQPAAEPPADAAPARNMWDAVIIRGTTAERRSFPLPTDLQPRGQQAAPAAGADRDAQRAPAAAPAAG